MVAFYERTVYQRQGLAGILQPYVVFADGGVFVANQSIARQALMQVDLNYYPKALFSMFMDIFKRRINPRIDWNPRIDGVGYRYGRAEYIYPDGQSCSWPVNWNQQTKRVFVGDHFIDKADNLRQATILITNWIKKDESLPMN